MIQNTRHVIQTALHGNRKLRIKGYRNSRGEVRDLEVRMIGAQGYRDLVAASLAQLDSVKAPNNLAAIDWATAVAEQRASWTNTTQTESPAPGAGLGFIEKPVETTPGQPPVVGLKIEHLESLHAPEHITDWPKSPVAGAKKWLQHQTPIGRYLGAVVLAPGKFESVELIPDAPISPSTLSLAEHRALAFRTEAPVSQTVADIIAFSPSRIRLIHAALGLTSEAKELLESDSQVNAVVEVGDAFWFAQLAAAALGMGAANLALLRGFDMAKRNERNCTPEAIRLDLVKNAGAFADYVKAVMIANAEELKVTDAEGQKIKIDAKTVLAMTVVEHLTLLVRYCVLVLKVEPEVVLAANIEKLRKRYPEKFSAEACNQRDTDREDAAVAATAGV